MRETAAILEEALDQAELIDDPAEASGRVLLALARLRQRGSFRRAVRGVRERPPQPSPPPSSYPFMRP